jgi:two-component system nitrogen regulation response regulator GlnG
MTPAPTLLVLDSDHVLLRAYRNFFQEFAIRLLTGDTAGEGLRLFAERRPDAVILGLPLPDLPGLEVLRRMRRLEPRIPVVILTGQGTAEAAIEAVQLGAYDFLLKPQGFPALHELVAAAFRVSRAAGVPAVTEAEPAPASADVLIGRSPPMQEVYKAIGLVAQQDINVLILGESGTGKELVARAIYQHSRRAAGPFLAINCAAIPETLLESELFGHEKGAFTGADRQRVGKFEQARGGTLFLDEVGDMTALTQAKILRALQEQRFERVGGNETLQTDVRVLAATNHHLEGLVAKGRFRGDLYYRLSTFGIALPPLRERLDDLPLLVAHFLRHFSRELGKEVSQVAPEALMLLARYPWPGNVRELQSVLKQALLRARGPVLLPEFLPLTFSRGEEGPAAAVNPWPGLDLFLQERLQAASTRLYAEVQELVERHLLTRVLGHTGGNQQRAAQVLGITRGKLRSRLRILGIPVARSLWSKSDQKPPPSGSPEPVKRPCPRPRPALPSPAQPGGMF